MTLHPILALDQVIDEYRSYLRSEFRAKDPLLNAAIEAELNRPLFLAQEPFFQAHRPFRSQKHWRDLPLDAQLAEAISVRTKKAPAYLHQSEAIEELLSPHPRPVVVTTGTGSGKTEAFLLPVIQNAIEDAIRFKQSGLTAVLVYPMNALANDQLIRIEEYLKASNFLNTVRVAKYDRSTSQTERDGLRANPPHILLTNYMMLEYLLVRPADRDGIFANHRCRFLVLDEVHTYRGTLGSNIALLVRRLRAHLQNARQDWLTDVPPTDVAKRFPALVPVGTSATIKTVSEEGISRGEALAQRDQAVQDFFGKLVGVDPATIRVFGEEIEDLVIPADAVYAPTPPILSKVDVANIDSVREALCALANLPTNTPLAEAARRCRLLWDLNRWLVRQPLSVSQLVDKVHTEIPERAHASRPQVEAEVEAALATGAALPDGTPAALRLRAHRFIRGGWHFHRCINPACGRVYPMGEERCAECGYQTAPLHLCRNCGADYLQLAGNPLDGPLHPFVQNSDEATEEYMLYQPDKFESSAVDEESEGEEEEEEVRPRRRRRDIPATMKKRNVLQGSFDPATLNFSTDLRTYPLQVILAPARTRCLCCGGTAGSRNVIAPLTIGTSAALKVMSEGLLGALDAAHAEIRNETTKERLLIFCDSRQDAAHQARFITFASRYDRMRRRLAQILTQHGTLTLQRSIELLGDLAAQQGDNPNLPADRRMRISTQQRERVRAWEEAPVLDEIAITAGYRATLVNLGLIAVDYEGLSDWIKEGGRETAETLGIQLGQLEHLCRSVLDEMRVRGALSRPMLRYHPQHAACPDYVEAAAWERSIRGPQGYACDEEGKPVAYLPQNEVPYGIRCHNFWRRTGAGGRPPRIGNIVAHLLERFGRGKTSLSADDVLVVISFLQRGAYISAHELFGYRESQRLLQINEDILQLRLLTEAERGHCNVCGSAQMYTLPKQPCPMCRGQIIPWPNAEAYQHRNLQRLKAERVVPLVAHEHTAQIPNDVRARLEEEFKAGADISPLNLLACSPTLEMGIDVGGLDAVALRNVPPRPDNYAQRGGRAGRRSRVGLVLGYARSTPHDQYFYDKPAEMIAGEVPAPALALGNRDVVLRHINAIAFGAAEPGLAGRMAEYISPLGELNTEAIQQFVEGLKAQFGYTRQMAQQAFGADILHRAQIDDANLQHHLNQLPDRAKEVFERTARQVMELRKPMEAWHTQLTGKGMNIHAGEMVRRLLGIPSDNPNQDGQADDRSAGYPLRRFAEFGILPGYEFPTEPATVRLLGDANESDPISTGRRFGIGQFQPDAQVYARAQRWKVIGLDTSSPWNPKTEGPNWLYMECRRCSLRFDINEPRCPRCGDDTGGTERPAFAYGGFIARKDEAPVLNEEERIAMRNLVQSYPQWKGQVTGRWQVAGWSLRLSSQEKVCWLNEGLPPSQRELDEGVPILSREAKGFLLCGACGAMLRPPEAQPTQTQGRASARSSRQTAETFGHYQSCPQSHLPPKPLALMAEGSTEILRLMVPVPPGADANGIRSWGLSLGYALHNGMCQHYMLDGSELEFILEGPWRVRADGAGLEMIALTYIDPSLGGTGYLRRIADEFHLVARRTLDHLDHSNCETACYRCLKSYTNQRHHEYLRWPLAVPDLEALVENAPVRRPLEAGDLDDPGPWLDAYAAGVGSPLELKFWHLFEQHGFRPQKQVPIYVNGNSRPLTIADFAVPDRRLAIYVDGASVHVGANLRRDRYIRERLRTLDPPWRVVELHAADLGRGRQLVEAL